LNQYLRCMAIELARYNPDAAVAALHPGTVDTALSKPFQGHVAPDKLQDPTTTAAQLWAVLDRLQPAQTGRFFAYDGSEIDF
jgi:NAD(P)-dependent dehydrogenase (short-subunit alcohol dehydrogenase family)